jgi:hypothetical protein
VSLRAEIGLALLLALGVTVAVVAGSRSGAPAAEFEPASTFASGPTGSRGPFEVLQVVGLKVERRRNAFFDLNEKGAHHPHLLVILDLEPWESALQSAELSQVSRFVRAGGALVLAGGTGGIAPCLGWTRHGFSRVTKDSFPVAPVNDRVPPSVVTFLQPRLDTLAPGQRNRCTGFEGATVDTLARTRSGRPVALDFRYPKGGRIILVADDGWFRNAAWKSTVVPFVLVPLMQEAAAGELVAFDEYHHGYGESAGTVMAVRWLLGQPVGWVLLQLIFVALIWLAVSAFRFGPARAVIDRRRRSPLEHLDALAAGLESAEGTQTALGLIVGGLRRRLSRTGQGPGGSRPDAAWIDTLTLAMPTAKGRGAVRRLREAFTKSGGDERVLAAANSVEDVWEELRPRTRDAYSKP